MNYLKVYCNLIRKAENRTLPEGYIEKHHTFPVSIFGKNKRIVVLTAREHYVAHALLERICMKRYGLKHWKTQKMTCAHLAMSCKRNPENKYINSYLYENLKIRYIENHHSKTPEFKEKLSIFSKNRWTEEERKKFKENNPFNSPEVKEKQRLGIIKSWEDENRRKEYSENNPSHRPEVKEKQKKSALERWNREGERERIIGKNNHFYGRTHTEEAKEKIGKYGREHFSGKNNPNSKTWKIAFECGRIVIVECLSVWAKENGYKYHNLSNVIHGLSKNHKNIIKIEVYETV